MLQTLIVVLLVSFSFAYALWALMPLVLRRSLANQLLKLPLPAAWARKLHPVGQGPAGCSCDGCGSSTARPGQVAMHPVRIHPRRTQR